ncbi:MAG: hypothetical protein K1000chlam3_00939, partial [Chlamydiae bacterium]|nr:hypothetical protein [Chlamydiota bacterium]
MVLSEIKDFFIASTHYDYAYTDYRKYTTLIEQAYSELPDISALVQIDISNALNEVSIFLWANKEWMIGGVAISGAALIAVKYFRSRPQYPFVNMQSTLNYARLSIGMPKREVIPPDITLTFCIDTSSSMGSSMNNEGREAEVKNSVNSVLNSAQKVVETLKGANIKIAIVGFSGVATIICEPTMLTRENGKNSPIEGIRANLKGYRSSGGTSIFAGLEEATTKLEGMANENKKTVHTFILLTDGEETLDPSKVVPIHKRLTAVNAQLFAIGIGNHKKETLKIIAPKTGKFTGTYIDTTLGKETIESAISKIYIQALAVFRDLVLSSSQLDAGTWSVNNIPSVKTGEQSKCELGSLSEGTKMDRMIQIHGVNLDSTLELSTVKFDLTFKDPQGRKGKLS